MSDARPRARRRALSGLLLALSLALVAGGGWLALAERGVVAAPPLDVVRSAGVVPPGAAASSSAGSAPQDDTASVPEAVPAPTRPGAPRRVVIAALGVDAPVLPVRAADGILVPPSDPTTLGWWAGGAAPGAPRGSVLLAGHTVGTGGGALDDLETLERGDRVVVSTSGGLLSYDVRSVRLWDKEMVAARAEDVFDQGARGRLVLLTCEDWDGQRYLSNVVVTATPSR